MVFSQPDGSGSSPLTRGLPSYTAPAQTTTGLIPADAGLTGHGVPALYLYLAHPR